MSLGETVRCRRCGNDGPRLARAPLPGRTGQEVRDGVCADCWAEWQKKQMQLINHYGLDVSNPETHEFLFDNMKIFFYDDGSGLATIDTSKEGSVNW